MVLKMNNLQFLDVLRLSYYKYLETGARSNEKLKILHGAIAADLANKLGEEHSILSLGYNSGKEGRVKGRYMDKNVDITISKKDKAVAAIGIKFVMSNYAQNANNLFENMLGETANIRSNNIPYFQILVLPDRMPYFKSDKSIKHWEILDDKRLQKYIALSQDNIAHFFHTPNKTLISVVDIDYNEKNTVTKSQLLASGFGDAIIYNDYEKFIQKVVYGVLAV